MSAYDKLSQKLQEALHEFHQLKPAQQQKLTRQFNQNFDYGVFESSRGEAYWGMLTDLITTINDLRGK